ncbi:epidermal growth factor receptor substrate 15-like isoform X2 [Salvelinus namaycush]|uniref:Epidermal growth factor receptor substrate 15-like isoform X2 n=1 Tax=Salvelinus namaycush TaxID=8040 RepID=A0A8U0P7R3_SALNM|nr:epidermal growth factor receptor substrate 15-like isoform X2 [Salvelinus namaycush]
MRAPETAGKMAALMTLTQLSSGNPAYEVYYRQVDLGNTGKVGAADAAQFLKKSGLSDSTLGKPSGSPFDCSALFTSHSSWPSPKPTARQSCYASQEKRA